MAISLSQKIKNGDTAVSVTQTSHGFSLGDVLYFDGTDFAKAKADAVSTLGLFMVSDVANANTFEMCAEGFISGLSSLTANKYYYVSDATAGAITATEPSTYSNPILYTISATEGFVLPHRPSIDSSIAVMPGFAVYQDAVTTLTAGTWVKVTFGVERWDNTNAFDLTLERFTPLVEGKYLFTCGVNVAEVAIDKVVWVSVRKNGVGEEWSQRYHSVTAGSEAWTFSIEQESNTTDYFELWAYNGDTTNRDTSGSLSTYFQAHRIGA